MTMPAYRTVLQNILWLGLLLACVASVCAESATALPKADLAQRYSGAAVSMPSRVFTPVVLEQARAQLRGQKPNAFFSAVVWGNSTRAQRWNAIAPELWQEIIAAHAPLSLTQAGGPCPLCGKKMAAVTVNLETPHIGKMRCCGQIVYAKEEDMPEGYRARPNRKITHKLADGSSHTYEFFVPEGAENEPARWFCAQGELWSARMGMLLTQVIPDLTRRLIEDTDGTDTQSARTLATIYERLAEVYGALPFYDPQRGYADYIQQGQGADPQARQGELLAKWSQPLRPWEGSLTDAQVYAGKLLDTGGYMTAGRLRHAGTLAEGYDILLGHPGLRAYLADREKSGNSADRAESVEAYDTKIRQRLFAPMNAWARQFKPFVGNMITVWFPAAMKLAVVAQDEEHLQKAAYYYNSYLRNHFFADGLSVEAAFNYSEMLGYLFREPWIAQELLGIDFTRDYPLLSRIRTLGDFPVVTVAGVESMHADEHAAFFTSMALPAPGDKLDYSATSQNFPFYGLAALRAGAPGSRLELIVDYQNAILHAHPASMNVQMFYQGVNLLPDVGYHTHDAKPTDARFKNIAYPMELTSPPNWGYEVEGHNTGTALGSQFGHNSVAFERYLGLPQSALQVVQADGKWIYRRDKWPKGQAIPEVAVFNRQLAAFTLPDGRALALDVFRMRGGWRHDLFWHAPASAMRTNLEASPLAEADLFEHYRANATPPPGWMKESTYLFHYRAELLKQPYYEDLRALANVRVAPIPADGWRISWDVDPSRYEPQTLAGADAYAPWKPWLQAVDLHLWADVLGSEVRRQAVFTASAPWAGHLEMGKLGAASRLAFKDALGVAVVHRQGKDANSIESTFLSVLDPATRQQQPAVRSVRARAAQGKGDMGFALAIATDCDAELFVTGSLHGGDIRDSQSEATTDARLAAAMPQLATATLFDGTYLRLGEGFALEVDAMPQMSLERVVGDLSGEPQQSALVVRASAPLPTGDALAGLTVNVAHNTSGAHVSAYEIERITQLQPGLYRIDLRNNPPFIQRVLTVTAVAPARNYGRLVPATAAGDTMLTVSHYLHDGIGRPNGLGRVLYFPASDFQTTLKSHRVNGYAGWWSDALVPASVPPARPVAPGDPLWILSVQPGDRVSIASTLSIRPVRVSGADIVCEVFSTGNGRITVYGQQHAVAPGSRTILLNNKPEQSMKIQHLLTLAAVASATALNATADDMKLARPEIEAAYTFDSDSGKYAKDSSGRHERSFITADGSFAFVDGAVGKALQLNGGSVLSVWKNKFALTADSALSFWVRLDKQPGSESHPYAPGIFTSNGKGTYDAFLSFAYNPKQRKTSLVLEDSKGSPAIFPIPAIEPGSWHFVALSIDAQGAVSGYFDGQPVGREQFPAGAQTRIPFSLIGKGYAGATDAGALDGALDEFIIYNRTLSAGEVADIYQRQKPKE